MRWGVALVLLSLSACQLVVGEDFSQTEHYCDPFTSSGCAAGEACRLGTGGKPTCQLEGTATAGLSCETNACVRGASCVVSAGEQECRAHCHVGSNDCGASYCAPVITLDGVSTGVCMDHCDLAAPHDPRPPFIACPASLGCALTTLGVTACFSETDTQGDGDSCATAKCKLGLSCAVYKSGKKVCEPYCRVGAGDCPGSRTCGRFTTALIVDGIEYGSCNTP